MQDLVAYNKYIGDKCRPMQLCTIHPISEQSTIYEGFALITELFVREIPYPVTLYLRQV